MVRITLRYMLLNETTVRTKYLEPEEYFDLEPGETAGIYSLPRHAQPYEYLQTDKSRLMMLHLFIDSGKGTKTFKQSFWNNGNDFITEEIESCDERTHRVINLHIGDDKKEEQGEVMRFVFSNQYIYPTLHQTFRGNALMEDKPGLAPFRRLLQMQAEE